MTDDIVIEIASEDNWDEYYAACSFGFNEDVDEASSAAERHNFEPERFLAARRDGQIVGTAGILTRQLSIPGAVTPVGHVTFVSVAPTARRRGVLTRFMHRQFDDMRAAGESIAVLWASEGRIYQRFGYGQATRKLSFEIASREVTLTVPESSGGRLREGKVADLRDSMVKIYDEVRAERPGWSERPSRHWDYRLADPESSRRGSSSMRAVVHEGEHGLDGYAIWRVKADWDDGGPAGAVRIVEQVAANPEAYAALWRFLLAMDLTRTVHLWNGAVDEPLQYIVNEPRRLGMRASDALWLRIIDLPAALSARRYATDVDVVIDVTDDVIPANAGRWRLTGSGDRATCVSTVDAADIACDVRALAAAYLGDARLASLAATGRVRELRPGALAEATTAFGWHRPPSTVEVF